MKEKEITDYVPKGLGKWKTGNGPKGGDGVPLVI